jgi:hypothetical protein
MVPEWILDVIEWLAYYLICKHRAHTPEPWYPTGDPETEARLCSRCLRTQHRHMGVTGPWVK